MGGGAPDGLLLDSYRVLLLLFDVVVLCGATAVAAERLVVPRVSVVTPLPSAVFGHRTRVDLFDREILGGSESQDIRVESAMLPNTVLERVSFVQDLGI